MVATIEVLPGQCEAPDRGDTLSGGRRQELRKLDEECLEFYRVSIGLVIITFI